MIVTIHPQPVIFPRHWKIFMPGFNTLLIEKFNLIYENPFSFLPKPSIILPKFLYLEELPEVLKDNTCIYRDQMT